MGFEIDFSGKICVVSGGGRGIGAAISLAFAQAKCSGIAILYGSNHNAAQAHADKITLDTGVPTVVFHCPAQDIPKASEVIDQVEVRFGSVDILICNAGTSTHKRALELTKEDADDLFGVNTLGPFWLAQAAARKWVQKNRPGVIVANASMSGVIVNHPQTQAFYNASKAGLTHLFKSLATEWAPHGIRVNTVSPGYVSTDMMDLTPKDKQETFKDQIPQKRFANTEEIANLFVFLASDKSTYCCGTDLISDGGFSIW